jgi:hypothetical protein
VSLSRSMLPRRVIVAVVALAAVAGTARADDLTPDQIEILAGMTPAQAVGAVEMAAEFRAWRDELAKAADGDREALVGVIDRLVEKVPRLRKAYAFAADVVAQLEEYERLWKKASAYARSAEATARYVKEHPREAGVTAAVVWVATMAPTAEEIRDSLRDRGIPAVLLRENPARYMREFAEGKLREWAAEPFEAEGLRLKVIMPPGDVSLFAPRTTVDVEIEYVPGEIVVRGTGLKFAYEPGQRIPRPVLDSVTVSPDFKATALKKLRGLGDELTRELDLPITVKIAGPPDFSPDGRGAIPFDVEIVLLGSDRFKAEAQGLALYPGNRVDWKEGRISMDIGFDSPVPIAATAFGFWSAKGAFQPRDHSLEFTTDISTLATRPEAVSLAVTARTRLPVRAIEIEGDLRIADQDVLEVVGRADFAKGVIAGRLTSGSLAGLAMTEGEFELRSERMFVKAAMKVLDQEIAKGELELDFTDGSGTLRAESDVTLFGVNFAPTLTGRLHAGCRRLELTAMASVKVPGIQPYGDIHASVEVAFDSDKACVDVKARCSAGTVRFSVPSFHACTLPALAKEIERLLVKNYHELLENMAHGEKDGRIWAAKLDAKTRRWVDDKFGVTWNTGNPELDRLGGELSNSLKTTGGDLSRLNQAVGGGLADARKDLVGGASRIGESAGGRISGAWKKSIPW